VVGVSFGTVGREEWMNGKPVVRAKSQRKLIQEAELGFEWGLVNSVLLGLGIAILAAGYLLLSKGSTTLAPALLVFGYVVLIPASLLIRSPGQSSGE
jgi:hypothetical protein